jgi:uncharacterized protein (DUF779 family)
MDRDRLIAELTAKELHTENGHLQVIDTRGVCDGVAFLCSATPRTSELFGDRDWAELDGRES